MIRQALRLLRKSPAYSLTSILTLGLGIGLTTAAFSLLNGLVLRPLPFDDPDALVDVHETSETELCTGCGVGTSYPIFPHWRTARSFRASKRSSSGRSTSRTRTGPRHAWAARWCRQACFASWGSAARWPIVYRCG